jgi:hypothetical protein
VYRVEADFHPGVPQTGAISPFRRLSSSSVSAATANIPSPRRRAEEAITEQVRLFPCCNLTRKTKGTCPCDGCPASFLHTILGVIQMDV